MPNYGALFPTQKMMKRPKLNFGAIVASLFLPWLLFCVMYATMSFSLHYTSKGTCYAIVFIGLMFVAVMALQAWTSVKRSQHVETNSDPSWSVFLAAMLFLAWVAGVAAGDVNYHYHMGPYYDTVNLNVYPRIDPAQMRGQQVMDAGRMTFLRGSKLDLVKTMAFHNVDTYCVAPVVFGENQTRYDFWAVGVNCCAGIQGDFACGEYSNPDALSGLRAMREDERPYFRLAVKQAESTFRIKAPHPIFLHWMEDPMLELAAYADEGFKYFLFGVYGFFAVLLFLVIVAAVVLAQH